MSKTNVAAAIAALDAQVDAMSELDYDAWDDDTAYLIECEVDELRRVLIEDEEVSHA